MLKSPLKKLSTCVNEAKTRCCSVLSEQHLVLNDVCMGITANTRNSLIRKTTNSWYNKGHLALKYIEENLNSSDKKGFLAVSSHDRCNSRNLSILQAGRRFDETIKALSNTNRLLSFLIFVQDLKKINLQKQDLASPYMRGCVSCQ